MTDSARLLPEYMDFLADFVWSPRRALATAYGKGSVDSRLLIFACASFTLATGIAEVFRTFTAARPKIIFFRELGRSLEALGPAHLPAFVMLSTFAVAVLVHIPAKVLGGSFRALGENPREIRVYLGGNLKDSVNAVLGFTAFYVPFAVFLVYSGAAVKLRYFNEIAAQFWLGIPLLPVYLGLALAACHPNTSSYQGMQAAMVGMGVIALLRAFLSGYFHNPSY